nr:MAG TPA: hypothetical protein [Caudoviricetes sp.]
MHLQGLFVLSLNNTPQKNFSVARSARSLPAPS